MRRGRVYCSTACGKGCTFAEYQRAKQHGRALAKRLGKGWKPRIWENLGWHYTAKRGPIEVYPRIKSYWANLILVGKQFTGEAREPELAVIRAIDKAKEVVAALTNALASL